MRATSTVLAAVGAVASAAAPGCQCAPGGIDAGADVLVRDVPVPDGAATDASPDTPIIDARRDVDDVAGDADPMDVGRDVPAPDAPDASCICEPRECQVATCEATGCVYAVAAEDTPCAHAVGDGVCLGGACLPRPVMCGDGYRRASGAEREACDDGNLLEGDGCDSGCMPVHFFVTPTAGAGELPPAAGRGVAIDDRGYAAYLWVETPGPSIWVRIFDPGGVAAGAPILIEDEFPVGGDPVPVIVGLANGWAVAWQDQVLETSASGIGYAVLSPAGALSAPRLANATITNAQTAPAIARTPTGFVLTWSDLDGAAMAPGYLMLRRFALDGTPGPAEETVDGTLTGSQASLATNGDGVTLITWVTRGPALDSPATLRARRLTSAGFVDPSFVVLDGTASLTPSVTALPSGEFAAAWVSQAVDFGGDIRAARIPASGPVSVAPITITDLATDETSPSTVALDADAFLVSWENGVRRGVGMRAVPDGAMPAEAVPALPTVEADRVGDWSFSRTRLGGFRPGDHRIWAAFSGYEVSIPGRPRAVLGYLFTLE